MGGAISTPPSDDTEMTADQIRELIGQDNFDQAKFDEIRGDKDSITFGQLKGLFPKEETPAAEEAPPDSEDDEDDGEEFVERVVKKGRKTGVSAESMDPQKMKDQMKNITCVKKSPEVHENLLSVVAKSPLLRTLDADQKEMIVNAFTGPKTVPAGEDIIVQGDNGEIFYLIESGLVDVYIKKDGADLKVHTYQPGAAFGELAIMYNAPRAATCRAQTEATVWQLDRLSFKCIVVAASMQKREVYQGFLKGVPLLESCNDMEIMTLADSLAEEKYEDGAAICNQGEEGEFFYIIKEGAATCYVDDAEVAQLKEGAYFGEIALLKGDKRHATVKAVGALKVLCLDRATFIRVLGPMEEILKRNMEQYNLITSK